MRPLQVDVTISTPLNPGRSRASVVDEHCCRVELVDDVLVPVCSCGGIEPISGPLELAAGMIAGHLSLVLAAAVSP